jgi:hypothetical protein
MFTRKADMDNLHTPLCTRRYWFLINVLPSHEIKRLVWKSVTVTFNADTISQLNLNVQWIQFYSFDPILSNTLIIQRNHYTVIKKLQSLWVDDHRAIVGKFLFQIRNFPPAMLYIDYVPGISEETCSFYGSLKSAIYVELYSVTFDVCVLYLFLPNRNSFRSSLITMIVGNTNTYMTH